MSLAASGLNMLGSGKFTTTAWSKILVVDYGTRYMGHSEFMCEALEVHVAILTIDSKGHVISASAFMVHNFGRAHVRFK